MWFGDAPGHGPACTAISGEPAVTEASVTTELKAANIRVIAVSTTTGTTGGLNGDPTAGAVDYGVCGNPGGTAGQATRIAAATGGLSFTDVAPADVSNAILAGLTSLPVTVKPTATCDSGLAATERSGTGDGRVYRIAFTVTDGKGGKCTGTAYVGVPHDQGHGSAVDTTSVAVNSFG